MKKEPIFFVIILLLVISISVFFIIKGFKTGSIYLSYGMKANRSDTPMLFWSQVIFLAILTIFFLTLLVFTVSHYFL